MENDKLLISHAPHIWGGFSTSKIMFIVVFALLFPTAAAIYFFGLYAIYIILISIATAVLSEFVIKKLRKKRFIMDGSAVVTGLLLALTLPPRMPLWMVVIGVFFAIGVVKEAFGGLGYNIFNPALAGRAFLSVCFPNEMTSWIIPPHFNYDAITGATPLSDNFTYYADKFSLYKDLFFGNRGGSLGETSVLLILIGAAILLILRIIDWKIPVIYIGIVALGSSIMGKDVLFQVMAGGLMIGAFFMATDYVTSPVTWKGRIIFAVGLGILTVLMRNFSNMPEGVCFSILIMNAFVPLMDKYVRIKPFGFIRKKKNA
jgi:electron transport complex protein RnfD